VALKVMPTHGLLNQTHLERFRREAKAAARLHHSNIVPVFGVGEYAGVHYYAMQFIQGESLDLILKEVQRLRRTKASPAAPCAGRTTEVSRSIAHGLLTGRFELNESGLADSPSVPSVNASEAPPLVGTPPPSTAPTSTQSAFTQQSESQYFCSVA